MDRYHEVIIDGVTMKVCHDCARYWKEITKKPVTVHREPAPQTVQNKNFTHVSPSPPKSNTPSNMEDLEEPIIDFRKAIKRRQEEMGLSQEVLANRLQEKKNLVAKIDREEIKPYKSTARKVKIMMGIRILEKVQ